MNSVLYDTERERVLLKKNQVISTDCKLFSIGEHGKLNFYVGMITIFHYSHVYKETQLI